MPAQVVTGQLNFTPSFQMVQTTGLISPVTFTETISQALQYINATGANKGVDQLYAVQFTLASTTTTLHFQTATLKDPGGNTLAMLRIRELIIQNINATIGQDLKVYVPASNAIPWIPPVANFLTARSGASAAGGGLLRFSDPDSFGGGVGQVVGATSDGLTLDSGSNTVTFNVIALGCSVA